MPPVGGGELGDGGVTGEPIDELMEPRPGEFGAHWQPNVCLLGRLGVRLLHTTVRWWGWTDPELLE